MPKLGTKKRPAVVRLPTEERAIEIIDLCNEHGWQVIAGIEPGEPEDISDVDWLLRHQEPAAKPSGWTPKVSPNDYCPCGSGKKHKNCCLTG